MRCRSPVPQHCATMTVPPAPMPSNMHTTRFVTGPTSATAAIELRPLLLISAVMRMPISMTDKLSSIKGTVICRIPRHVDTVPESRRVKKESIFEGKLMFHKNPPSFQMQRIPQSTALVNKGIGYYKRIGRNV